MLHFSSYAVASNSMIWSLNKCWVWKNNIWSFFIRPPVWICSLVFKVNVSCLILEFFIGSVGTLEQNCVNGLKLYVPLGILKAKQSCWTSVLKLEGLCSSQTLLTIYHSTHPGRLNLQCTQFLNSEWNINIGGCISGDCLGN
jgi:hypothetical protein